MVQASRKIGTLAGVYPPTNPDHHPKEKRKKEVGQGMFLCHKIDLQPAQQGEENSVAKKGLLTLCKICFPCPKNENLIALAIRRTPFRGGQPFKRLGKGKATVHPTQGQALRVLQYFFDNRFYFYWYQKNIVKTLPAPLALVVA